MPIGKAKSDIRISDDLYSKTQAEEARILAEMARLNESGKSSPEVFQALQSSFDFHHGQSQKFASERSDAWDRFNSASAVFHKYLLKQIQSLALQQIPVMVEIRRDLGLTGDLAELEAHTHQQMQRMEAQFDALLATFKNP